MAPVSGFGCQYDCPDTDPEEHVRAVSLSTALLLAAVPLIAQTTPTPATPATPATAPTVRAPLPNDSLALARKYATWFATSQADSIFNHLPAGAQAQAGSAANITAQFGQVTSQIGNEAQLVEERWVRRNGMRQYWRIARYTDFAEEPFVLRIVILPDGGLGGIGMNPLSQVPQVDPEP